MIVVKPDRVRVVCEKPPRAGVSVVFRVVQFNFSFQVSCVTYNTMRAMACRARFSRCPQLALGRPSLGAPAPGGGTTDAR